ncbi:glycosyltransferase family 39 protein, partial [Candidatus Curtissbacteria bacterium]|nr:glycosyltransferase family 39 protein [Candidatus Curtissbacteria bacterium]
MKTSTTHYILIAAILMFSFFFRVYRINDLLRFYYDQGRDALVIKEMIEKPKPILIGPTTGLAGIFRGPAYYYLIAPGYLIGGGNPVVAAIWLQLINVVGLVFIFLAAKELFSVRAGIIALLVFGLSHEIVSLSRWLSNPSPILTSVPIMLYALARVIKKGNPKWWYVIALMLGLNLQFEMASEIWFIPALAIVILLKKIKLPHPKMILKSAAVLLATFLPQVIFDIRHDGIIRKGIQTYFAGEGQSFFYDPKIFLDRVFLYLDGFADLIKGRNFALSLAGFILILALPFYLKQDKKKITLASLYSSLFSF